MIGGEVLSVDIFMDYLSIIVKEKNYRNECMINLISCDKSRSISEGDEIWWHGDHAYWTPMTKNKQRVGPTDIKIERYRRPSGY